VGAPGFPQRCHHQTLLPARHRFAFALGVARQVTMSPLIFPWLRRQADHLASNMWWPWSAQARSDWSWGLAFHLVSLEGFAWAPPALAPPIRAPGRTLARTLPCSPRPPHLCSLSQWWSMWLPQQCPATRTSPLMPSYHVTSEQLPLLLVHSLLLLMQY
jgi:hypothetical protein